MERNPRLKESSFLFLSSFLPSFFPSFLPLFYSSLRRPSRKGKRGRENKKKKNKKKRRRRKKKEEESLDREIEKEEIKILKGKKNKERKKGGEEGKKRRAGRRGVGCWLRFVPRRDFSKRKL